MVEAAKGTLLVSRKFVVDRALASIAFCAGCAASQGGESFAVALLAFAAPDAAVPVAEACAVGVDTAFVSFA